MQDCASTLRLSLLLLVLVRSLLCLFVNTYCLSALACRTGDIFCLFCFSGESDVGDHEAQDARRKGGEKSIITLIFRIYLFLLWLYFSPPFPSAARVWRSPPQPRPPFAYPPPCQSVKKKITPVLQSRSVWFMKTESCRKLLTKIESYGNGGL